MATLLISTRIGVLLTLGLLLSNAGLPAAQIETPKPKPKPKPRP